MFKRHCRLNLQRVVKKVYFRAFLNLLDSPVAAENPQRIRSGTDAAGPMQKQVCRTNLQSKSEQGCTFLGEDSDGSIQQHYGQQRIDIICLFGSLTIITYVIIFHTYRGGGYAEKTNA